jgi:hypothetical protein
LCAKFLCTQWSNSMHFCILMPVSISFYTLLDQFYVVFMRQQIHFLFIELLISMHCRHKKLLSASWSLILWIWSSITCYFSNFKFQIFKKTRSSSCFTCAIPMFYVVFPCQLYILILGSMILVKATVVVLGGISIS